MANRLLSRDGTELPVPPRAIGVLWCLVARAGRIVSRQQVLDEVWKDAFVSDTSLAEAVSLVRQVLGDDPQQPTYIQTVPRRGYRFVAPVVGEDPDPRPNASGAPVATTTVAVERLWTPWLPFLLLFVAGVVIGLTVMARARPAPPPPAGLVRFTLDPPPGMVLAGGRSLAVSRDGATFAMVVRRPGGRATLALRRLDSEAVVPVPDSDGASAPAFSPDGKRVAFFAGARLLAAPVAGGAPTIAADAPAALGAAWMDADHIVFASHWTGGLDIADVSRGSVRPLTHPDTARGEMRHAWPELVPSAAAVAFSIAYGLDAGGAQPAWVSLRTGSVTRLELTSTDSRAVTDDHLLLFRPGTSAILPVDRKWTGSSGVPLTLPGRVSVDAMSGGAAAAFSDNGVRVAVDDDAPEEDAWIGESSDGARVTGLRGLEDRAVSPDGRRVAAIERQRGRATLWAIDLVTGVRVRVAAARRLASPAWAPDGRTLAVGISEGGPFALALAGADDPAPPRTLARGGRGMLPASWTPDGTRVIAMQATADRGWDLVSVPATGGPPTPLVATAADEVSAAASPDAGRLAYLSNASGEWTLLVRPLDGDGPALAVAPDVRAVAWADASTLVYLTGDRLLSVPLSGDRDRMEAGRPQSLATGVVGVARGAGPNHRLLATLRGHRGDRPHVVLGWFDVLRAHLAANAPMPRSFR
jgi:DNA-binding winged helix-turn-helix (wHTH) protein